MTRRKQAAKKPVRKKKARRAGRGKRKGSAFERQVARMLSLWLTDGNDSVQLIRSVLSGGWGKRRVAGEDTAWRQVGDLASNGEAGERFRAKFAVECKKGYGVDFHDVWTRAPSLATLHGWWAKISEEARDANLTPLLVFRGDNKPLMAALPTSCVEKCGTARYMILPWLDMIVFPLDDLLATDPNTFLA